ncbi:hypothetical protein CYMTET_25908, partial [Cymbomonas tetramitiformis]
MLWPAKRRRLTLLLEVIGISLVTSSSVPAGHLNYALKSLGATATASGESCFNGYCSRADQVLEEGDGTFWTEWLCTSNLSKATPVWLLVDLGQQRHISSVFVRAITDTTAYTVQVAKVHSGPYSIAGLSHKRRSSLAGSNSETEHIVPSNLTVRFIKLQFTLLAGGMHSDTPC